MKKTSIKTTDISFTRVTEFFVEEIRKGNAPSVDVFARAFPHLAEEIACELPAIEMIERAAGLKRVRNQPAAPGNSQLGGCVIQEEIGRGGWGLSIAHSKLISIEQLQLKY